MNIVIDTNVLMSALIKPDGVIFDLISFLQKDHLLFISDYSLTELANHYTRILKSSKLSVTEFESNKAILFKKVDLIASDYIPDSDLSNANLLVMDVDRYDTVFVAAALSISGFLWTGDKVLYNALKSKKFNNILNTADIRKIISNE